MTSRNITRLCVALSTLSLVLAAAPAGAKSCGAYKPKPPASPSGNAADAPSADMVKITDKATEKKPLVVEFHQDPGLWTIDGAEPIVDSSVFLNFQVLTKAKATAVSFRAEWMYPTVSDIDFYLFDRNGAPVGQSAAFSPLPAANQDNGGEGFELIETGAANCDGFTLESRPFISPTGEDVSLKIWLD